MSKRFVTAPYVLLVILFMSAVLFGPLAAALQPLLAFFAQQNASFSGSPIAVGTINDIADVLFVYGPLAFLFLGIGFVVLAALRLEGVLR